MRIFAILAASAGLWYSPGSASGTWTAVPTPEGAGDIRSMAAEAGFLAIQTQTGVYLTANQGADWQWLRPNKFSVADQRIQLSNSHLFVSGLTSRWLYRYSLAQAAWDSLMLPAIDISVATDGNGPKGGVFAAHGDRAALAASVDGHTTLFLSSDEGSRFQTAGSLPPEVYLQRGTGMAVNGDTIAMSDLDPAAFVWRTADGGHTWKSLSGCGMRFGGVMSSLVHSGSGFHYVEWTGRILATAPGQELDRCPEMIPYPPEWTESPRTDEFRRKYPQLAASGTLYFYSLADRIWSWDENPSPVRIHPGQARSPFQSPSRSFPVRAWSRPRGDGHRQAKAWIDAKGALREP
jgi:hypothetical protein